jgi:hypothetical protein
MCRRRLFLAVFVWAAVCSLAAQAGVVVISRLSSLEASGQTSLDQFDLSDQFTTVGSYDHAIGDSVPAAGGGTTQAQASQQSDVSVADGITGFANGQALAQVAELDAIAALARSAFLLVFDVTDQVEAMNLSGRVESTFDASARVALTDDSGATVFFERLADIGEQEELTFAEPLLLDPGRYRLLADGLVTGTPAPNTAEFAVDFRTGGLTVPIPLPAAFWPGLILVGVALLRARARR